MHLHLPSLTLTSQRNGDQPTIDPSLPGTHLPTSSLLSLLRSSLLASQPNITPMELSDRLLAETSLLPPPEHASAHSKPPASGGTGTGAGAEETLDPALDPLRRRIAGLLKKNGKVTQGKVRVVLLCLSGIRCAEVVRQVRGVKGDGVVAKVSKGCGAGVWWH